MYLIRRSLAPNLVNSAHIARNKADSMDKKEKDMNILATDGVNFQKVWLSAPGASKKCG